MKRNPAKRHGKKPAMPRNPYAVQARFRKGGPMRDRRAERGGSRDRLDLWLAEAAEETNGKEE